MASQRDQVQAYTFLTGRLSSALVRADADAPRPPLHRTSGGTAIGLVLGLLAAAGLVVWGFVAPSAAQGWKTDGTVVVDSATGARYVYSAGVLYPVLNYSSALLVGGGKPPTPVADRALAAVPHGQPVGIPGAPDALPAPAALTGAPWLVCASTRTAPDGKASPVSTLRVDSGPTALPGGVTVAGPDAALLVADPSGVRYLVWGGTRLRVPAPWTLGALGLAGTAPTPVGYAFLAAVPAGPDLLAPSAGPLGAPGPAVNGAAAVVGQVFVVRQAGVADQYFVLRGDGLAPLTDTGVDLLRNDPDVRAKAYAGRSVEPTPLSTLAGVPMSASAALSPGLPPQPPRALVPADRIQVPCVRVAFSGASQKVDLVTAPAAAATGLPAVSGPGVAADPRTADEFALPPGGGVLVTALTGGGVPGTAHYVVADSGVKYPVPDLATLGNLGYHGAAVLDVPQTLLALLPTGPGLDPAAATRAVPALAQPTG